MALENPYATEAQVRAEIKNTSASVEDSINQASRWIDKYKRRDYFEHDYTSTAYLVHTHSGLVFGRELFLPYYPVISVTEIKEGTEVLTADEDYIQLEDRLIRMGQDWAVGDDVADRISLKMKLGYDQGGVTTAVPTGLPDYINKACILVAAAFSGENKKDVVSIDGSKETVIDNKIPDTVYMLLGKRPPII